MSNYVLWFARRFLYIEPLSQKQVHVINVRYSRAVDQFSNFIPDISSTSSTSSTSTNDKKISQSLTRKR